MLDHYIMLYRAYGDPEKLLEIEYLAKEIMEDSKKGNDNKIKSFFTDLEIQISDEQVEYLQGFIEKEKEDGFAGVISAEICEYMRIPLKYQPKIRALVFGIWNDEDDDLSVEP